jgi:hypothetical protein
MAALYYEEHFENIVLSHVGGVRLPRGRTHPYDILSGNSTELEVKGCLGMPTDSGVMRVRWNRLLGFKGKAKKYKRLIAVAKFHGLEDEPMFFDIPYDWVVWYCRDNPNRDLYCPELLGYHAMHYDSQASTLWYKFHCTGGQLRERYNAKSPELEAPADLA